MSAGELERLALGCILPGFARPAVPEWVRRRLDEGLGGVVLYAWNVESREQLRELCAEIRSRGDNAVLAIDEEGGDVTRLEAPTGSSYPGNGALGVVDDAGLTERVAAALGADLADVGVNLDFAPVADVNTNPLNPVIGIRAFGEEPALVARHVAAFVRGMQGAGVGACAKHFPGHGDTVLDSHLALPAVDRLEDDVLSPFAAAIDAGVAAIMTAHIVVRSLGDEPATMSRALLHDALRVELGFRGLVVTDALEMRAISHTVGVEEGAVRSLAAGVDALCLGHDLFDDAVVGIRDALVSAVRDGRLGEERLAEAAERTRAIGARRAASGNGRVPRKVGLEAARRAVRISGAVEISPAPVVVELESEPGMAAGRLAQTPGDWFRELVPRAELVRVSEGREIAAPPGRDVVVLVRDAHRYEWERAIVESLAARTPKMTVVELGLPRWTPTAATYVATHGAGRVNVEAAIERLYSDPRRGVEQSGSSPGS